MKKNIVAVALAVVFVMALAAPAFAMTHTATYEMDGVIDFEKQAGHLCNTGAEMKQTISGEGQMSKVMDVAISPGVLTVDDANDWVAGETSLTVTSVWELCAPPKYTYEGDKIHPSTMYNPELGNQPDQWFLGEYTGLTDAERDTLEGTNPIYAQDWDAVSPQIWAAQVEADPGYSGNLHQSGEAAYGPFWGDDGVQDYEDGWDDGEVNRSNTWRWQEDSDGLLEAAVGVDYVGNYFVMDQHARTSQGTVQRYIDISSPWTGAYLMEDMSVVGASEIDEAFSMENLPTGEDTVTDWWVLF